MRFDVLTIFPEYFHSLKTGVVGRAIDEGKFEVRVFNIRDFTHDKHLKTDDTPYGGGAGMLMNAQPIASAIEALDPAHKAFRVYMSPKGKKLVQKTVMDYASKDNILILCGNYEGVDERVIDMYIDEEISVGDYVLTGGELPALVLINAVSRYIEGVLGSSKSTLEESFSDILLEYPQYTKPYEFKGLRVPEVLLSGNHRDISDWRMEKSLEATMKRRPDLLVGQDMGVYLPSKPKKKKR